MAKSRGRPVSAISAEALATEAGRIGARLRAARRAAGIPTIRNAARLAGVPETRWSDWERGKTIPRSIDLPAILQVLSCKLGDLIPEGD